MLSAEKAVSEQENLPVSPARHRIGRGRYVHIRLRRDRSELSVHPQRLAHVHVAMHHLSSAEDQGSRQR